MPKSLVLLKAGSHAQFEFREQTFPPLPVTSARVQVHFAGINFADALMMLGMYPDAPKLPAAPGYEIAGVVTEAGSECKFKPGARVAGMTIFGGYAEEVIVEASQLAAVPDGVTLEEAVSLPVNYMTAAVALHDMARIRAGDRVLVHGGAGGVGRMALQIAKQEGAETYATVSTPEKFEVAKEAGADYIINYKTQSFPDEIRGITKGKGIDIVLDPVGGKNLYLDAKCLAPGGTIILFGLAGAVTKKKKSTLNLVKAFMRSLGLSPMLLMNRNIGIYGLNLLKYSKPQTAAALANYLRTALASLASGELKALVSRTYPLAEAKDALEFILSGKSTGKLVLRCTE